MTNATKHTPGPWVRGGKNCLTIAQKAEGGNLGDIVCIVNGDESPEADQANARLIAASPKLLKACIAAHHMTPGWQEEVLQAIRETTGEE